jgi:hypothetical protein
MELARLVPQVGLVAKSYSVDTCHMAVPTATSAQTHTSGSLGG